MRSNISSKPFMRWAGSKRKLLSELCLYLPEKIERYIEPFCGSASLFFEIEPENAILSDINEELINALKLLKTDLSFHEALIKLPNDKGTYYKIRSLDPTNLSIEERAIRFFYLNRFCFNGVYRTNLNGEFNVPYGTRTGGIPSKDVFQVAQDRLVNAEIYACDYHETITKVKKNDFIYLDPPYTKSNSFSGEYGLGSFKQSDFFELVNVLCSISSSGGRFLLSYRYDEKLISLLESQFFVEEILIRRHISGFKQKWETEKEILVRNYE